MARIRQSYKTIWHVSDSQGQILALALREKSFLKIKLFPRRAVESAWNWLDVVVVFASLIFGPHSRLRRNIRADIARKSVTLVVGILLCPYGVAYRRA